VPEDIPSGSEILVQFLEDAGIENTCVAGTTYLYVWTDRAPDSEPLAGKFKIKPTYSTYYFMYDFGATYPGVAANFVPPFRACGQNDSLEEADDQAFNTTFNVTGVGGWFNQFKLVFEWYTEGCYPPCDEAKIWFELIACPTGEEIHLQLNAVNYTLDACNITDTVGEFDLDTDWYIDDALTLTPKLVTSWDGFLHFSSPGEYEIAVYAECPQSACDCIPDGIIASLPQVFKVYQDKEAFKLTLCEKWNLFSLPLVPLNDPSIEGYLASINMPKVEAIFGGGYGNYFAKKLIDGMWYYDAFDPDPETAWKHWALGADDNTLTELADGKAYWLYVNYPIHEAVDDVLGVQYAYADLIVSYMGAFECCDEIVWWIWGTGKPVPPAAPSQYAVNTGWNMVGFTSTNTTMNPDDYLWNWGVSPDPDPVVYGYSDDCWNLQTWELINFSSGLLEPGEGYFMAFPHAGTIFVP
jgi:hypothetical protein